MDRYRDEAFQTAHDTIAEFLENNDICAIIVIFDKNLLTIPAGCDTIIKYKI